MDKKLRMLSKQRLTTLVLLGLVTGVGYQMDNAHAATNSGDIDANTVTKTGEKANDTQSKQVVIGDGSQSQSDLDKAGAINGSVDKGTGSDANDGSDSLNDNQDSGDKSGDNGSTDGPDVHKNAGDNGSTSTDDKVDNNGDKTGGSTVVSDTTAKFNRGNLLRAADVPVAPTIVDSGVAGTSKWTKDSNGVMTIYGGNFQSMGTWASINKVVFALSDTGQKVVLPKYAMNLFQNWFNITEYDGLENVDASNVVMMNNMFSGNTSLKSIDLSSWDMSNVTSMTSMFSGGYNDGTGLKTMQLQSVKLGSTTGKVTDMSMMFSGDQDLSDVDAADWNVDSLQSADALFRETAIGSLDLSGWNTSKLTSMNSTFAEMPNVTSINVADWDTSKVNNLVQAFQGDPKLSDLDVSKWDVSSSKQFGSLFDGDASLATIDLSNWHPMPIAYMIWAFRNNSALTKLDLSNFDLSGDQGISIKEALSGDTNLKELILGPNTKLGDADYDAGLPDIPKTDVYTGLWQAVGTGTVDKPAGATFTSAQLNTAYDGATMADTYVWQKVPSATTGGGDTGNTGNTGNNGGGTTTPTTDPSEGGNGATVDPGTPVVKPTTPAKKPAVTSKGHAGDKKTSATGKAVTLNNGGAAAKVTSTTNAAKPLAIHASANVKKTAANDQSKSQLAATVLPQTGEQRTSWLAVIAGALSLGFLGLNWFKRQN
ncbi:BspA family leucine-rich repeat surface protein [Levilactobacillus senmaizukei]|nr:BspA family leucine-rich repeat surface protein [Levilactobacillus senmaizukei]